MRIANTAEYRLPVELIGADAEDGAFRGDAQTRGGWRFDSSSVPGTKEGSGSECFVSRPSKIMYS